MLIDFHTLVCFIISLNSVLRSFIVDSDFFKLFYISYTHITIYSSFLLSFTDLIYFLT